jgi:16S rRNA (uracil1498-N3)-methyltransferase
VERDDRSVVATFYHPEEVVAGSAAALGEDAAHHARVKRLAVGDVIRLTDGCGHLATGSISQVKKAGVEIAVDAVRAVAAPPPIHLCAPIGDRDRMLWLAEKAAELSVASWQSIAFRRSMSVNPRGDGPQFAKKLRSRMVAALEQSGGAWLPEIRPEAHPEELHSDGRLVRLVLDPRGAPLLAIVPLGARREAMILLGPEGGIEPDEMKHLMASGWRPARLASTTLRFETAGVAAIAALRAAELEES